MIQENEQETREREIAELKEDVRHVKKFIRAWENDPENELAKSWKRILDRLTAILEEKKRGSKI